MPSVTEYAPTAAAAADAWGPAYGVTVPLELVLAIMQRENPRADPGATALEPNGRTSRGLMQVLDTTALELGLSDPTLLTVPGIGIDYGVHYLAKQLRRYGGDVPSAVAAYNAGTARRTAAGSFSNQGYVDAVLGFFQRFRSGLGAAIRSPIAPPAALALLIGAGILFAFAASRARERESA